MNTRNYFAGLSLSVLSLAAGAPAFGLANRVFVSARSGNNANACDNVHTPCLTLQGAMSQLNANGEAIVIDSGAYGTVTITQGVTIEAPAGVTASIRASSGDAITVDAGTGTVTLRGLVLNAGTNDGIRVNSVGTLNVENCFITGFEANGILMASAGRLNLKGTDIKGCFVAVTIAITIGLVQASVDHCHMDANQNGYVARTRSPGSSTTTATYSTANNNSVGGWFCGAGSSGKDVLNLEFCTGSANGVHGLTSNSTNAQSTARYSNCVFANNEGIGVAQSRSGIVESRVNSTITGNGSSQIAGTVGFFPPR